METAYFTLRTSANNLQSQLATVKNDEDDKKRKIDSDDVITSGRVYKTSRKGMDGLWWISPTIKVR